MIIVKEEKLEEARALFKNSGIKVTTDANRYLGSALGSEASVQDMLKREVRKWSGTMKKLSDMANIQPHPLYAAFVHGIGNQWSYLMRTTPDLEEMLHPLEEAIARDFLPALIGRDEVRELLALPARLRGLDISIPTHKSSDECEIGQTVHFELIVLYAVDKGLRGRNVLHQLLLILLRICSRSVRPISTT